MKKALLIGLICLIGPIGLMAEESQKDSIEGWQFTTIDSVAITPVKDQNRSGTCWCFSTIAFLESEIIRKKGIEMDLSEMFVVSNNMLDRATYYVRQHGEGCLYSPGGQAYDVIYCMENNGLVPEEAMPGIRYSDTLPNHNEVDAISKGFLNGLTGGKVKKLTPVWREAFQAVWDTYLGKRPEKFDYNGKTYTPRSFVEWLGLNSSDYVSITSFTHHPFYTRFALEVPDNWRMDQMYNVPLDEMMQIIDYAVKHGYTLCWDADISDAGFTRSGIGVVLDKDYGENQYKRPYPELEITQEMRQTAYDNWSTVDDHLMQIFGIAKDQNGKEYYMVKNSWGTKKSDFKGIWYVSHSYMAYKTCALTLHKDAIPKEIRKKLGIK